LAARLILLLFAALAAGCSAPSAEDSATLRIAIPTAPLTLDPRFATDAASVRLGELVHCRLIRLNDRFAPVGELAERWRAIDPYTWLFTLRTGFSFADGTPVRAQDVAATLNSLRDPRLRAPLAAAFAALDRAEAVDARTVRLVLKRPDASLLVRLGIGILPKKQATDGRAHPRDAIGCGAFRLASWRDGEIELLRRDAKKKLRRLRFVVVRDPITRALKLVRGEVDLIQGDVPAHLLAFLRRQGMRIAVRPSTTFAYLGLNLRKKPLSDPRVRKALALAIDRKAIARALFAGLPQLAETVLPEEHWAGVRIAPVPFDPKQAERLLDQAGYPRGEDGIRFRLLYRTSTNPERLRLAQAIQAMWQRIGVAVRIESLEWGAFYARIKRGDFDVFSLAWVGITDPDIYRWILHSKMQPPKGANRGGFVDPEVDAWLDRAAASLDPVERAALYRKVARRMHDAFVYIPLWREPAVAAYRPIDALAGYRPPPDGGFRALLALP